MKNLKHELCWANYEARFGSLCFSTSTLIRSHSLDPNQVDPTVSLEWLALEMLTELHWRKIGFLFSFLFFNTPIEVLNQIDSLDSKEKSIGGWMHSLHYVSDVDGCPRFPSINHNSLPVAFVTSH